MSSEKKGPPHDVPPYVLDFLYKRARQVDWADIEKSCEIGGSIHSHHILNAFMHYTTHEAPIFPDKKYTLKEIWTAAEARGKHYKDESGIRKAMEKYGTPFKDKGINYYSGADVRDFLMSDYKDEKSRAAALHLNAYIQDTDQLKEFLSRAIKARHHGEKQIREMKSDGYKEDLGYGLEMVIRFKDNEWGRIPIEKVKISNS